MRCKVNICYKRVVWRRVVIVCYMLCMVCLLLLYVCFHEAASMVEVSGCPIPCACVRVCFRACVLSCVCAACACVPACACACVPTRVCAWVDACVKVNVRYIFHENDIEMTKSCHKQQSHTGSRGSTHPGTSSESKDL